MLRWNLVKRSVKTESDYTLLMDGPGVLLKADAGIITAIIVIQIVNKRSLHTIPEDDPDKAKPARDGGRALFRHNTDPPLRVSQVNDLVTQL
jgi:hypothetical protein